MKLKTYIFSLVLLLSISAQTFSMQPIAIRTLTTLGIKKIAKRSLLFAAATFCVGPDKIYGATFRFSNFITKRYYEWQYAAFKNVYAKQKLDALYDKEIKHKTMDVTY